MTEKKLNKKALTLEVKNKKLNHDRVELNKQVRHLVKQEALVESINTALQKTHKPFPKPKKEKKTKNGAVALFINSDVHLGKDVDTMNNTYNYKIAQKRQVEFIRQSEKIMEIYGVQKVIVGDNGDITEHNYMRKTQQSEVEFQYGEQIKKALEFRLDTINTLADKYLVEYFGTIGNHDRLQGSKDEITKNSSSVYIINSTLDLFFANSGINKVNTTYEDNRFISFKVNGKHFRFEHGHLTKKTTKSLRDDISQQFDTQYDMIVTGHYHSYNHKDGHVSCGSLVGADSYSEKLGYKNTASQVLIIVTENGDIYPFRIELGHIQ